MSKKKKNNVKFKQPEETSKSSFTLMHRVVSLLIVILTIVSLVMTFGFK